MASFYDRVKMGVAGTPGAGAITLGAAAAGYRSFDAANVADQATVSYVIEDGANWEIGHGVYTKVGTSLARSNIIASSNAGAAINADANATVYLTLLASDIAAFGSAGTGGGSTGSTATPPTIVQHAYGSTGTVNAPGTITLPAAPTPGNLLVLFLIGLNFAPVSGWNTIATATFPSVINAKGVVQSRPVTSSDTATIQVVTDPSDGQIFEVYEITGVSAADLIGNTTAQFDAPAKSPFSSTVLSIPTGSLLLGTAFSFNGDGTAIQLTGSGIVDDATQLYLGQIYGEHVNFAAFHKFGAGASFTASVPSDNGGTIGIPMIVLAPYVAASSGSGGSGSTGSTGSTSSATPYTARYWRLFNLTNSGSGNVALGDFALLDSSGVKIPNGTPSISASPDGTVASAGYDGNSSNQVDIQNAPGNYFAVDFGAPVAPAKFSITNWNNGGFGSYIVSAATLQCSTDGTNWTTVTTWTNPDINADGTANVVTIPLMPATSSSAPLGVMVSKVRATFPPGTGYYAYCVSEMELVDSTGTKIAIPSGSTFSASSNQTDAANPGEGAVPASAFDGNTATSWISAANGNPMTTTEWLEVDLATPVRICGIALTARPGSAGTGQQMATVGNFTLVNASGTSTTFSYGQLAPVAQFAPLERRAFMLPVGGV